VCVVPVVYVPALLTPPLPLLRSPSSTPPPPLPLLRSPSSESDHQSVVQRHCDQLMEFQGKMTEACQKFESLEEEHIAQMVTFMYNISQVGPSCGCVSSLGTEYVVQTVPLIATDPGNPQWTGRGGVLRSACSAGLTLCGETAEGLRGSQGNRHRKTQ